MLVNMLTRRTARRESMPPLGGAGEIATHEETGLVVPGRPLL